MTDLIDKLREIARQVSASDALVIESAIKRIRDLEDKLSDYEEDITDWQFSVEQQMNRGKDNK